MENLFKQYIKAITADEYAKLVKEISDTMWSIEDPKPIRKEQGKA